jgi:hypothetical protein
MAVVLGGEAGDYYYWRLPYWLDQIFNCFCKSTSTLVGGGLNASLNVLGHRFSKHIQKTAHKGGIKWGVDAV